MNLLIAAKNDETLKEAFARAGWREADEPGFLTLAKTANSFLFHEAYLSAPIAPSFWNGRADDIDFVKSPAQGGAGKRHEAGFWRTDSVTDHGLRIYAGIATFSEGFRWWVIPRKGPYPDNEREGLFRDLRQAGAVASGEKYRLVPPLSARTFTGDPFRTDGYLYVIRLK